MTRDAARSAALPEAGLCCVVVTQQEGSRQRPSQSSDEGKMRDERIRHFPRLDHKQLQSESHEAEQSDWQTAWPGL